MPGNRGAAEGSRALSSIDSTSLLTGAQGEAIQGIESIRLLAETLGRMPDELRKQLRPKMLAAAQLVQRQAQVNASWSTRIPGAITASATVGRNGGAVVRVNRAKAPHARPYEGVGTHGETFRHPVFADANSGRQGWTWVNERKRSFLFPALSAKQAEAMGMIADAVRSVSSL